MGFFENQKNHIFKEGDYDHNVVQCTIKTGFILRWHGKKWIDPVSNRIFWDDIVLRPIDPVSNRVFSGWNCIGKNESTSNRVFSGETYVHDIVSENELVRFLIGYFRVTPATWHCIIRENELTWFLIGYFRVTPTWHCKMNWPGF